MTKSELEITALICRPEVGAGQTEFESSNPRVKEIFEGLEFAALARGLGVLGRGQVAGARSDQR